MTPRTAQRRALNQLWQGLWREDDLNQLLVACCSAGKTIIFSCLIRELLGRYPTARVLILADKEILVQQAADKLSAVAPELIPDIGICCAAIGQKNITARVVIASRQSFIGQLDKTDKFSLCIFDEVHLVSVPIEGKEPDQFGKILQGLRKLNPLMRFIGCTATPYRLGHGYIYGDKCRADCTPYFAEISAKITIKELLNHTPPYLAPIIGRRVKSATWEADLQNVGKIGGDYNQGELSEIAVKEIHLQSIVDALELYGKGRKKVLIFCVNIAHCEAVAKLIPGSIPVHSKNNNHINMTGRVFVSVAKLIIGVDCPELDLGIIARATQSPSLHVQMCGRFARLSEGKKNALLVDLVGNSHRLGLDLDNPVVKIPHVPGGGEMPQKICPGEYDDGTICGAVLHAAVRICPDCGNIFSAEQVAAILPELSEIKYNEPEPPVVFDVASMIIEQRTSQNSGKEMLCIEFSDSGIYRREYATLYLMFPDDGYSGYPVQKTREIWKQLAPDIDCPDSAEDADFIQNEIRQPKKVEYEKDGTFKKIINLLFLDDILGTEPVAEAI